MRNRTAHQDNECKFMFTFSGRGFAILAVAGLLVQTAFAAATAAVNSTEESVEVQIIALNDLHGQLEPPSGSVTLYYNKTGNPYQAQVGGIEYLATQVKGLKATNPNTVIVSAGDNIGASTLLSSLFHEEPTIEALSQIGLEYSAVGNHEFDNGVEELARMQYGGCNRTDGCRDGKRFAGAGFRYMTANVVNESTGKTLFPPYQIQDIQGIPVAFIGVALKDTPSIALSSEIAGLKFLDEADCINAAVRELKQKGVKAIVVLLHDGGYQSGLPDESLNLRGDFLDVINRTDDEVDIFVKGHSHQAYISRVDGRLVTQADWKGHFLTDIDLTLSKETGDVVAAQAKNVAVTRSVPKDPDISKMVERYSALAAPLAEKAIGSIKSSIIKDAKTSGESALGDVIADAQLYATAETERAVAAFMNPGGIRSDLIYNSSDNGLPENVTYADAFSVQPFSNALVTMNLTGSQIDKLLEQQFDNPQASENRILQVSRGFAYTWSQNAPTGGKVDINFIKIEGIPINANSSYRITVNNFLADGGDNFEVLTAGTNPIYGAVDLEALVEYFKAFSPISPGPMDRIKVM